jgi:PhnB protein
MAIYPYLNFGGNCRQAFGRYREIFGGDLEVMTMGQAPAGMVVPPEQADLVMHAALTFDGGVLMASDDPSPDFGPVRGMYVTWSTADVRRAHEVFAALAEGGSVEMPITGTFWSPAFGVCTDRFGTPWMIMAEGAAPAD